ncbi:MAG: formylmethanofuran dehydrogenase [Bacteroidetes bacterium]|nr:formylmethanofuran dehydrogenase [Bacteroidota bacterium]
MNLRKKIDSLIKNDNLGKLLIESARLHGHYCPGLALGVMAAQYAMKQIDSTSDGLEDMIAITETNNCFSDGVQYVTGCTFGNNALVFNDFGKTAFTLCKRDGYGIRISVQANSKEYIHKKTNGFTKNYKQVVENHNRDVNEVTKYKKKGKKAAFALLDLDFRQIFKVEQIKTVIPAYAPSHQSLICDVCGESVMSTRIIEKAKKKVCKSCSSHSYMQLNGDGILIKHPAK